MFGKLCLEKKRGAGFDIFNSQGVLHALININVTYTVTKVLLAI